ncbi:sensor histidine kinase [Brachybacterium hainanense]|uniref:histidine kinase n=1 Tax=Brachybacterium hainanense TaxID=1541174 RepID=A0ABV6RC14_9MICO
MSTPDRRLPSRSGAAPVRRDAAPPRRGFDPFRWVVEHPGWVDLVVFGGAATVLLCLSVLSGTWELWVPFSVLMIGAGAFLRTRTGWATLAIGVLAVLHFVLGEPFLMGDVMIFYALFCATVHAAPLVRRLALGAAFFGAFLQAAGVAVGVAGYAQSAQELLEAVIAFFSSLFVGCIAVLGTWAIGRYQHVRVDQLRLAREAAAQAVQQREQRTALAVADERARIAREMHDVVAHSLSVIIAQADGGRFVAAQSPEKAQEVLTTIGSTGRAALADMRGLLGVLRQEEETSFGPQPGLDMLDDLVGRVRSAGLAVDLERQGDLAAVPHALSLTVFRVVQEALTNVMKHAGPGASARIRLLHEPGMLRLDVLDDGRGHDPDSDGQGHGLTGMRERISAFHGELQTGPLPGGGYRVSARIPLQPPAARGRISS